MKINDLINTLQHMRNEYGNIEVLKWDLQEMKNISNFEVYYIEKSNDINEANIIVIL